MKSGNSYYVDVSEYTYDEIYTHLTETLLYEDNLSLDAHGKTHYFKSKDIEYFELNVHRENIKKNKIGF